MDILISGMNGFEVLAELQRSPFMKRIPVIVFTRSRNHAYVEKAYRLGARLFVNRPQSLPALAEMANTIVKSWLGTASLPPMKYRQNQPFRIACN